MTAQRANPAGLPIVIIGGGSAAFAAATKAVENGAEVTMIESDDGRGTQTLRADVHERHLDAVLLCRLAAEPIGRRFDPQA